MMKKSKIFQHFYMIFYFFIKLKVSSLVGLKILYGVKNSVQTIWGLLEYQSFVKHIGSRS